jgi:hypothetical protein
MGKSEDFWEVLRQAGYEPTDESRRHARERLERAHVDADARIECRERIEEIMAKPS